MKKYIALLSLVVLCSCATNVSPTATMTEAQIAQLSDRQLCELRQGHQYEPKLEVEMGKRDTQCTESYLSCKQQGYSPRTGEFQNCEDYYAMRKSLAGVWDNILRN